MNSKNLIRFKAAFDPEKFELLGGLEASDYALRLTKEELAGKDVVQYFQENLAEMDLPHLEVAVYLLSKIGTQPAWNMVADYLAHPAFRVRFVATKMIRDMTGVDEQVMRKTVAVLSQFSGDGLADELKILLDRPVNDEARRIAKEYIDKL